MYHFRIFFSAKSIRPMQQTPNPAAQVPALLPPLLSHSDWVKQVPFLVLPEQGPLGKLGKEISTTSLGPKMYYGFWILFSSYVTTWKMLTEQKKEYLFNYTVPCTSSFHSQSFPFLTPTFFVESFWSSYATSGPSPETRIAAMERNRTARVLLPIIIDK